MTALAEYARLEAPARYFDGHSALPREVMLNFGERSLVIMGYDGVAIAHWPLASLRAISRRGDPTTQLVPHPESDERIILEDREMIQAIARVCPNLYARPVDRRGLRRALAWGVGAVGAVLALVFVIIPELAGQLAPLIPPEREQKLGDAVVAEIQDLLALPERVGLEGEGEEDASRPLFCGDPAGLAALERMTTRLDPGTDLPYPVRVSVLDFPMINAFAVPGGRIVLFSGLIDKAESPEEVAGVLAHEMAHVVHRDPTVGVLRAAGTAGLLGMLFGDIFGATILVAGAEAAMNADYQRDVERRADETAYRILADAGLPTEPFAKFFQRLLEKHGDTGGVLRYLASHPALRGRAERAEAADRVSGQYQPVLDDRAWVALREICSVPARGATVTGRWHGK